MLTSTKHKNKSDYQLQLNSSRSFTQKRNPQLNSLKDASRSATIHKEVAVPLNSLTALIWLKGSRRGFNIREKNDVELARPEM